MYDGNQVLRFDNKYKRGDLGGLGIELTDRKGTGNYDKERTKFNTKYVPLDKPNLASQVYSTLEKNDIYYNDGKNVNLVNGAIVTSGQEFFQSLGMKFTKSDRTYKVGKKKGQQVLIPDIKSEDDIPLKVKEFFDNSFKFLEDYVGKENIVYAEVHYDEDTPHMHFYFLPVVNEVKRKLFKLDNDGNIIKHEVVGKDGKTRLVPIQLKDENGKNMYRIEKGKFLNCDQFWKDKGGKTSFAKIQDDFNKYITEKGFNLFRGNIGDNVYHRTKAEKEIEDLQEELKDIKKEFEKNKKLNDIEIETTKNIKDIDSKEILNPTKKKLGGYKNNEIEKLIEYSKNIQKENSSNKGIIKQKDILINDMSKELESLNNENSKLKDGRAIKERDTLITSLNDTIKKQKKTISEKNSIIESLEDKIDKLEVAFNNFKNKMFDLYDQISKALYHLLGHHNIRERDLNYEEVKYQARKVNRKYEKDKSDDFDLSL